MTKFAPDHSKISPTAKAVAYWRQFSDVPYAQDVARLIGAEAVIQSLLKNTSTTLEDMHWFAPLIEARYKSMVNAIRRKNIKQVLELASGVSLRGLAMTSDPEMIYVETDLPEMSAEKIELVREVQEMENLPERKNLFFKNVNVLSLEDLKKAVAPFSENKPIAIIHEGLFQYLSLDEKKIAATHFHSLLSKFGGVWMTPDLNTKEDVDESWDGSKKLSQVTGNIEALTQRSFRESAFENAEHRTDFFNKLGFEIEEVSQIDENFEFSSAKRLKISKDKLNSYYRKLKLWNLQVK
jgi:O-methyltransferase involved in polyketide biosynthesis